jgi:hypothetical protein
VSGLSWDATDMPAVAFIPIALGAVLIIVLAPTLRLASRGGARV